MRSRNGQEGFQARRALLHAAFKRVFARCRDDSGEREKREGGKSLKGGRERRANRSKKFGPFNLIQESEGKRETE